MDCNHFNHLLDLLCGNHKLCVYGLILSGSLDDWVDPSRYDYLFNPFGGCNNRSQRGSCCRRTGSFCIS